MSGRMAPTHGVPWRLLGWGGASLLLLVPLVAMRFTDEVAWTAFDFAFAAAMLGAVGLGLELAFRRSARPAYRLAAAIALATGLLVVWLSGAVGIIGSEREDANLPFLAVLLVALAGALAARFRPSGMARAMAAAALAQVLAPLAAWLIWPAARPLILSPEVAAATAVFAALWLASGWLFSRASAP